MTSLISGKMTMTNRNPSETALHGAHTEAESSGLAQALELAIESIKSMARTSPLTPTGEATLNVLISALHAHRLLGDFWTASEHEAPPQDGKPFWAWLHQTGIRQMIFNRDLFDDGGGYVLDEGERDDEYEPDFWAPLNTIPDPAVQFAHLREACDPTSQHLPEPPL